MAHINLRCAFHISFNIEFQCEWSRLPIGSHLSVLHHIILPIIWMSSSIRAFGIIVQICHGRGLPSRSVDSPMATFTSFRISTLSVCFASHTSLVRNIVTEKSS